MCRQAQMPKALNTGVTGRIDGMAGKAEIKDRTFWSCRRTRQRHRDTAALRRAVTFP